MTKQYYSLRCLLLYGIHLVLLQRPTATTAFVVVTPRRQPPKITPRATTTKDLDITVPAFGLVALSPTTAISPPSLVSLPSPTSSTTNRTDDGSRPTTTNGYNNGVNGVVNKDDLAGQVREQQRQKFLVHKGISRKMIKRSPAIAGVTIVQGWSDDATTAFRQAVDDVVRSNPILTGHVYEHTDWKIGAGGPSTSMYIQPGTFTPDNHDFVRLLEPPPGLMEDGVIEFDRLPPQETLDIIQTHIEPLLGKCEQTSEQMLKRLPLLEARLLRLPGGYAAFSLKVSHAVGDGVTFFQILKQISMRMSGLEPHPIDWNCRNGGCGHEIFPPTFSDRDVHIAYDAPMMLGALRNFPSLSKRSAQVLLLDKSKIIRKRTQLRRELGNDDISSNDVVTSALCEANGSADIFVFTENVRGAKYGVPVDAGGNYLWEVPVSRESCSDPDKLRNVVVQDLGGCSCGEFRRNELPWRPFVEGRVGRITSLASVAQTMLFDGVQVLCTVPLASFIGEIPLDVGLIFRYDKNNYGVLHNFAEFCPSSGMLGEILADNNELSRSTMSQVE